MTSETWVAMFCSEHLPLGLVSKPGRGEVKPPAINSERDWGEEKGPTPFPPPTNYQHSSQPRDTWSIFIEHFLCLSNLCLRAKRMPMKHDSEFSPQGLCKSLGDLIYSFINSFIHQTFLHVLFIIAFIASTLCDAWLTIGA